MQIVLHSHCSVMLWKNEVLNTSYGLPTVPRLILGLPKESGDDDEARAYTEHVQCQIANGNHRCYRIRSKLQGKHILHLSKWFVVNTTH